jgi:hypothetical protein
MLMFGNVGDPQLFTNYSFLYFIQHGDLIKVYPLGSAQYWGNLSLDLGVLQIQQLWDFNVT